MRTIQLYHFHRIFVAIEFLLYMFGLGNVSVFFTSDYHYLSFCLSLSFHCTGFVPQW